MVRGGEGTATTHGDVPDGQVPPVVDGFDVVVAAAARRRGAVAPDPPAGDDISDPWEVPLRAVRVRPRDRRNGERTRPVAGPAERASEPESATSQVLTKDQ